MKEGRGEEMGTVLTYSDAPFVCATKRRVLHTIFFLSGSKSWNMSYLVPKMVRGTGRGSSRSLSGWAEPNFLHAFFFIRSARAGLEERRSAMTCDTRARSCATSTGECACGNGICTVHICSDVMFTAVRGKVCLVRGKVCLVRGAVCLVRGKVCLVRGTVCLVRGKVCLVHGTVCLVRGKVCLVRGAVCLVRGTVCLVRGAVCLVRGTVCLVRGAVCLVRGCLVRGTGVFGAYPHIIM